MQRIFREETGKALAICRHPARERGETVHETRKHLKKLRAAIDLVAPEIGKRAAREDRCARDIGKLVSDLRDAHVRLQTLIELRGEDTAKFAELENLLTIERESFSAAFADWQEPAISDLEQLQQRLACWDLEDLTWKNVCRSIAQAYRDGRDALARALKTPSAKCVHAWRKEVKRLWYQLRLLTPLNPVVLKKIAADADSLGELLGCEHDYAFLLQRFEDEQLDPKLGSERADLEKLIGKHRRRLQRNAMELAGDFMPSRRKRFAKRISIFIKDWVAKKK